MKYTFFAVLVIGAILLMSCKSNKDSANTTEDNSLALIFGNSGGFAGKTVKYMLSPKGKVFIEGTNGQMSEEKSIDKNLAAQFFDNFTAMGFNELSLDDPGNMTYFIIVQDGDRKKKLAWGGMNQEVPAGLEVYYKNFMKLMKKNSSNPSM